MTGPLRVVAIGLCVSSLGLAAEPQVEARLDCAREPAPGRVLCELELETRNGRLAWADALVERAPDFAPPLRSRLPATERANEQRLRASLALGARSVGTGELSVLARYVYCPERGVCQSGLRRVRAEVIVGTASR